MALARHGALSKIGTAKEFKDIIKKCFKRSFYVKKGLELLKKNIELKNEDTSKEMFKKIIDYLPVLTDVTYIHTSTTRISVFYQFIAMNILIQGYKGTLIIFYQYKKYIFTTFQK